MTVPIIVLSMSVGVYFIVGVMAREDAPWWAPTFPGLITLAGISVGAYMLAFYRTTLAGDVVTQWTIFGVRRFRVGDISHVRLKTITNFMGMRIPVVQLETSSRSVRLMSSWYPLRRLVEFVDGLRALDVPLDSSVRTWLERGVRS
jgi:hypothetical protein